MPAAETPRQRKRRATLLVVVALVVSLVTLATVEAPPARGSSDSDPTPVEEQHWSELAPLNDPRRDHTVTLLPPTQRECGSEWCRKVLVVGGRGENGDPMASVELYDPAAGTSIKLPGLITPRFHHTATLLPVRADTTLYFQRETVADASLVVVTGGVTTGGKPTKSTEIFDTMSMRWLPGPDLQVARWGHTATFVPTEDLTNIQPPPGVDVPPAVRDVNDTTRDVGNRLREIPGFNATKVSGRILVVGGSTTDLPVPEQATDVAEWYAPADDTSLVGGGSWSPADSTHNTKPKARAGHTATRTPAMVARPDSHFVVVIGGSADTSVDVFNVRDRRWLPTDPPDPANPEQGLWTGRTVRARRGHTVYVVPPSATLERSIRIVGGSQDGVPDPMSCGARATATACSAEQYRVPVPRATVPQGTGGAIDPTPAIPGGSGAQPGPAQPRGRGHTLVPIPRGGGGGGSDVIGGLALGGDAAKTGEVYGTNPGWPAGGHARPGHAAVMLGTDTGIVMIGGACADERCPGGTKATARVSLFRSHRQVAPALPMNLARSDHTASLLPDDRGRVLVAGGTAGADRVDTSGRRDSSVAPEGLPKAYSASFNVTTDTAELYIPDENRWEWAAPMAVSRTMHAATVLDGPRCRAAGEAEVPPVDPDDPASSVETGRTPSVTDPGKLPSVTPGPPASVDPGRRPSIDSTRPSVEARLGRPRYCGAVLVTGGYTQHRDQPMDSEFARNADQQPSYSVLPPTYPKVGFGPGRFGQLVIGQPHERRALPTPTTELYLADEAGGAWAPQPLMTSTRAEHSATLLDPPQCRVSPRPAGYERYPCGKVLIVGGFGLGRDAQGDAADTADPTADHRAPDVTKVYPGDGEDELPVRTVELYAPDVDARLDDPGAVLADPDRHPASLVRAAPLKAARARHAAVLLADGRVAVIGGVRETVCRGAPESIKDWKLGTRLPCDGNTGVAAITGQPGPGEPVNAQEAVLRVVRPTRSVEIYDPATDTWAELLERQPDGTVVDGGILSCRNQNGTPIVSGLNNPNPDGACHRPRTRVSATLLPDGRVLMFSGSSEGGPNAAQLFTPPKAGEVRCRSASGAWAPCWEAASASLPALPVHSQDGGSHGAVLIPRGGRVLVGAVASPDKGGGVDRWWAATFPNLDYDTGAKTWSGRSGLSATGRNRAGGAAQTARLVGETMTLLKDSSVLVAGGWIMQETNYGAAYQPPPDLPSVSTTVVSGPPTVQAEARFPQFPRGYLLHSRTPRANTARHSGVFVPGPPRDLAVAEGEANATVSWEPPATDGGAPALGYVVVATAPGHQVRSSLDATQRSVSLPGVRANYDIQVQAENRLGAGAWARSPARAPAQLLRPLPPSAVVAEAGDASANLSWMAPPESDPPPTDGTAVSGYVVSWTGGRRTLFGRATTTLEVDGLRNGTSYNFEVYSFHRRSDGSDVWSLASARSLPVVPGRIRTAPTVTSMAARDRSALVSWAHGEKPGLVDTYTVTASPGGASVRLPGEARVALVPGLTNDTSYTFRVLASNRAGAGPDSAPSAAVTPTLWGAATPPVPAASPGVATVTDVAPRGGPVTGGPEVVVTGTGFATAREVRFGDVAAPAFSVISDHQIAVTLPPHDAPGRTGRVAVVVANDAGASDHGAPDAWFHYGEGGWDGTGSPAYNAWGNPWLLADGRVLAPGRAKPTAATVPAAAAVYDAAAGTWEPKAAPASPSDFPFATARLGGVLCGELCDNVLAYQTYYMDALQGRARGRQATCHGPKDSYSWTADVRVACTEANVPQLYDPGADVWRGGPKKTTAANGPAVVLDDGRVLVAGGCCQDARNREGQYVEGYPVSSAEVFVPGVGATGMWMQVGDLPLPLVDHTLTVMRGAPSGCGASCGKVLAAGGFKRDVFAELLSGEDSQVPLPPPAIFDPVANTWRTTKPMQAPRYGHGAVALPDGKVMVVGGSVHAQGPRDPGPAEQMPLATATAEVFDPVTESWSYLRPMATRRYKPATLLLSDGRVLVAGGFTPDGRVASAELYDPRSDTWSPAGALRAAGEVQLVELPASGPCGANCGKVLAVRTWNPTETLGQSLIDTYTLPASIDSVTPASGPAGGGTPVTITGSRFTPNSRVFFGGVPATSATFHGRDRITAVAPPAARANSPVTVLTEGGTATAPERFRYTGLPGAVENLAARAVTTRDVELTFSAAGSVGNLAPPAGRYVVKQSRSPITDATFDNATSLCGGTCTFVPAAVSEELRLAVGGLAPGTQYHYAVAAVGDGGSLGPVATTVVETPGVGPGRVSDLSAEAASSTSVVLRFAATGIHETEPPPAGAYVVKQSTTPIASEADFHAALSLCEGLCRFEPASVGAPLTLNVADVSPKTTYYYALRAQGPGGVLGPMSNVAEVTTPGPCPPPPPAAANQVSYGAGYSLLGLPGGSVTRAAGLFGWFNMGSGSRYSVHHGAAGVEAGRGYWGWFSCPTTVAVGPGTDEVRLPLAEYHASMVGNPSSRPAELSGHDFAARWDQKLNNGAGGYVVTGYRERLPLAVGQGGWAFSYEDTTLTVRAKR